MDVLGAIEPIVYRCQGPAVAGRMERIGMARASTGGLDHLRVLEHPPHRYALVWLSGATWPKGRRDAGSPRTPA